MFAVINVHSLIVLLSFGTMSPFRDTSASLIAIAIYSLRRSQRHQHLDDRLMVWFSSLVFTREDYVG